MTLDPCFVGDRLVGLLYADAQQFLGVPARSLEDVFLSAVRHGVPSPTSLADLFSQLYERIGHLLYQVSFVEDPAVPGFVLDVPRLQSSLAAWTRAEGEPLQARQSINTWAVADRGAFRDPVDFLEYVCQYVPWRRDPAGATRSPLEDRRRAIWCRACCGAAGTATCMAATSSSV